jgi:hypothetical protein
MNKSNSGRKKDNSQKLLIQVRDKNGVTKSKSFRCDNLDFKKIVDSVKQVINLK